MRCLVVFCHPVKESFGAALRDRALAALGEAGHDLHLIDLYADGFEPAMAAEEWRNYEMKGVNEEPVVEHVRWLRWAEMIVFVYPTWWYGLPAMLKGWLDRAFVPFVAFDIPTDDNPRAAPKLTHIKKIAVVTTCGATWWWSKLIGEPGRKTILRGIRVLCARRCKSKYLALYKMDLVDEPKRQRYLEKVYRTLKSF
jgi:putative NADPH-quinone reductase